MRGARTGSPGSPVDGAKGAQATAGSALGPYQAGQGIPALSRSLIVGAFSGTFFLSKISIAFSHQWRSVAFSECPSFQVFSFINGKWCFFWWW